MVYIHAYIFYVKISRCKNRWIFNILFLRVKRRGRGLEYAGRPELVRLFIVRIKRGQQVEVGQGGMGEIYKSAVIDYFAGEVSQITRPFILKTMTMQTLNS